MTPGTIETPWVQRLLANASEPAKYRDSLERRQPMRRLGKAEEVAAAVMFLSCPSSSFITGIVLPVDGGMFGLRVNSAGFSTSL